MSDEKEDNGPPTMAEMMIATAPAYVECVVVLVLMWHGETVPDLHGVKGMRGRAFLTDASIANRSQRVDPTFQAVAHHLRTMAADYDAQFAEAGYEAITVEKLDLGPKPGEKSS